MILPTRLRQWHNQAAAILTSLHSSILSVARAYIAWVFFKAGLTKINDWESTLLLFEYEYEVPFISYELAAYLGTFGEIVLPILLLAGLLTRISAIGLFIVNAKLSDESHPEEFGSVSTYVPDIVKVCPPKK